MSRAHNNKSRSKRRLRGGRAVIIRLSPSNKGRRRREPKIRLDIVIVLQYTSFISRSYSNKVNVNFFLPVTCPGGPRKTLDNFGGVKL